MALAEDVGNETGDYDRVGEGMRFFDDAPIPEKLDFYQLSVKPEKTKAQ